MVTTGAVCGGRKLFSFAKKNLWLWSLPQKETSYSYVSARAKVVLKKKKLVAEHNVPFQVRLLLIYLKPFILKIRRILPVLIRGTLILSTYLGVLRNQSDLHADRPVNSFFAFDCGCLPQLCLLRIQSDAHADQPVKCFVSAHYIACWIIHLYFAWSFHQKMVIGMLTYIHTLFEAFLVWHVCISLVMFPYCT